MPKPTSRRGPPKARRISLEAYERRSPSVRCAFSNRTGYLMQRLGDPSRMLKSLETMVGHSLSKTEPTKSLLVGGKGFQASLTKIEDLGGVAAHPDLPSIWERKGKRPLVVLIHGDRLSWDHPLQKEMAALFESLGMPVLRMNIPGGVTTEESAKYLNEALRETITTRGDIDTKRVIVIAHSKGGMVYRRAIKNLKKQGITNPINVIISSVIHPSLASIPVKKLREYGIGAEDEKFVRGKDPLEKFGKTLYVLHREDELCPPGQIEELKEEARPRREDFMIFGRGRLGKHKRRVSKEVAFAVHLWKLEKERSGLAHMMPMWVIYQLLGQGVRIRGTKSKTDGAVQRLIGDFVKSAGERIPPWSRGRKRFLSKKSEHTMLVMVGRPRRPDKKAT